MKKKWLSAIVAAALSVCVLTAPISVPNTITPVAVQAASSGTTLADMPSTYVDSAKSYHFRRLCERLGNDLRPDRRWKRNTQVCCKMAEQTDDHTGTAK